MAPDAAEEIDYETMMIVEDGNIDNEALRADLGAEIQRRSELGGAFATVVLAVMTLARRLRAGKSSVWSWSICAAWLRYTLDRPWDPLAKHLVVGAPMLNAAICEWKSRSDFGADGQVQKREENVYFLSCDCQEKIDNETMAIVGEGNIDMEDLFADGGGMPTSWPQFESAAASMVPFLFGAQGVTAASATSGAARRKARRGNWRR